MNLSQFDQEVSNELFEQAVNLGKAGSGKYVQQVCNAFNRSNTTGARIFTDLVEDDILGPRSLGAIQTVIDRVCPALFTRGLNIMQGAHYINLANKSSHIVRFSGAG